MRQKVDKLHAGDIITEDVINSSGVLLIGRGAVLGTDTIRFLMEQEIATVEIEENENGDGMVSLEECIQTPPEEYKISQEIIDNAIDERSAFKEQYIGGIEAIRNIDVEATTAVARDICDKIVGISNLQEELSMLRQGCDSVLTHSMNVAIMTATLIVWAGNLTSEDCFNAVTGAMLHDIGKFYVPRDVLEKPSRLDDREYRIIQQHAELGYMKLRTMGNVSEKIALMAYEHHENVDGTGYPRHLSGDEIQTESKIIHIADVYEAMTARRCYKEPMLPGDVTEFTMSKYGTMFDEESVKTFLRTVPAYKSGDMVMLSNMELAEVIECNVLNSLRPKVRLMRSGEEIDLFRNREAMSLTIVRVV